MHDAYYTPASLAALWRCSTDVIYDLLRSGELHGFKVGREWRVSDTARAAFEAALAPSVGRKRKRPAKLITRIV